MTSRKNKIAELAPCGVYCGACPSFNKSCKGCSSSDKNQKRKSKFNCRIRTCCYQTKHLNYCVECDSFPCPTINKKLLRTHLGKPQFTYRHEIVEIVKNMKTMGLKNYSAFQKQRWQCKLCGGTVQFYYYKCNTCGQEQMVTS